MTSIEMTAKNVRMQMQKKDLTHAHIAHRLKVKDDLLRSKLNGRMPFSNEELELLAPYLETTIEALTVDPEAPSNGRPPKVPDAAEAEQRDKTTFHVNQLPGLALIGLTNQNENLRELLHKTFMAKLTGKIDDLDYYIRNNLLVKVLKHSDEPVTEQAKVAYVEGCKEEYERWKAGLVSDIDDVMEVGLSSNEVEVVSSVLLPSGKGRLSQFMNWLIKDNSTAGVVEIEVLALDVEKGIEHLQKVKRLIEDFLAACE